MADANPAALEGFWRSLDPSLAALMAQAADFGEGRLYPGGPDAQPARAAQAWGIIQAKIAKMRAKDKWKANQGGGRASGGW